VREIHAHDGMLVTRAAIVQKKTFAVRNVDARAKTLIVEYPVRAGYKLIETAQPIETARDVYRFEVKVPSGGSVDFPVTAENVYDQQTAISSLTPDALLVYVRNKNLSDAGRRQLQQVADLKTRIADADRERSSIDSEIQNTTRDEDRTRQNIASLSQVGGQQQTVQDYARRLGEQEAQIAKLRDRQTAADAQRKSLQIQLNDVIAKLEF
jgi:ABC-type enterochelin transport system substrate-binding protein